MNSAEVEFLYLPVFYWGAFVLWLYRHDLSRLFRPFTDKSGPSRAWSVLLDVGLLTPRQAASKPTEEKHYLPYSAYMGLATGLSLSWVLPWFPRPWYYLVAIQAASGLVLTMATVRLLGRPPRRPYVDVLRHPRLGSRVRHFYDAPSPPATESPDKSQPKKKVRYFNASLKNGIVVSTPSYPEKQAFVAQLVHALETANPDFAWVQFLFVQADHHAKLVRLKNSIHRAKKAIEEPAYSFLTDKMHERRELHRDFYRMADARMTKVDVLVTRPTVVLAIQGMWVGSQDSDMAGALPFAHCSDEHDSLAVFQYRDPRMLRELVDRRMVTDIGEYLERFTGSRLEPPSFMAAPEGLRTFVHLPVGEAAESLQSIHGGPSAKGYTRAKVKEDQGEDTKPDPGPRGDITSRFVRLAEVPEMKGILEDSSIQPLDHLPSTTVRTFELLYSNGHTEFVFSSETVEDMRKYAQLLDSVYGELKLEKADQTPGFLQELPRILGLGDYRTHEK
jgi:hypothetical protein